MVTTTADLNLHPDLNGNVKIFCSQYDNALREIVFNIYDGDTLADLTDLTAKVEGTKPDKYGYSYDATIRTANSTVTVTLVTQMTCVAGLSHAEIVLYDDDSRVGTANFLLMVEEAGISDDTIVSDSVIPGIHNIDTLVEHAQAYADNAEASALEAEGYAAGTQNGTEVESGSEYYEHNAKYYCEQAWRATPEGYADLVQQVETNTSDIATNATDISNVLNMLCDEWSSTVYYRAGDWLHYNGVLYKVNIGAQTAFAAVVPPNAAYYDVKTITEALEELRSIIADTYSDMQTYTAGQIITYQGKLYKVIVDCTGITPPNTSYYTATTVAELIADNASDISTLNSSLTNQTYILSSSNYTGNIASGDDLDDYTTCGTYVCPTAGIAQSLSNCPVTSAFKMVVATTDNAGTVTQTITVANTRSFTPYIRSKANNTVFGDWSHLAPTDLITTKIFSLPGVSMSAGAISDYTYSIELSGYTPIGIISTTVNTGQKCVMVHFRIVSSTSAIVRLLNTSTSTDYTPGSVVITVLYIKTY